ncbi:Mth938-like domain-containing protein [Oxalobacter vibrioformis]|uniref:Mth938-like domain-containing protein n=1 Tax=Oxalobacter vibrioformis TaxID=933080 RepID=A0A9E9LV88_9BURK|nr:Mth938-like domain-containing protein [Oxalobacter vibrioformis]WAW09786.1 Mth938-like domain-containing protein [Oxalobacter vibrioformis]
MTLFENQERHHQAVTAYDEKSVTINHTRFSQSVLVLPDAAPALWPVSDIDSLAPEDFSAIIAVQPNILIIGTGLYQRLLSPPLLVYLSSRKIGVETMNTHAACRTFNLLLSEGRRVALALFLEDTA